MCSAKAMRLATPTHMERLLCAQHLGVDLADPSEPRSDGADRRHQNRSQKKKKKEKKESLCVISPVCLPLLFGQHAQLPAVPGEDESEGGDGEGRNSLS